MSLPSGREGKPIPQTDSLDVARTQDSSVSSDSTKSETIKKAVPYVVFGVVIFVIFVIFIPRIVKFFKSRLPEKKELSDEEKKKLT